MIDSLGSNQFVLVQGIDILLTYLRLVEILVYFLEKEVNFFNSSELSLLYLYSFKECTMQSTNRDIFSVHSLFVYFFFLLAIPFLFEIEWSKVDNVDLSTY